MNTCRNCGKQPKRKFYVYCSNVCQQTYQYKQYIEKWKLRAVTGERGIVAKNISQYLKRYLLEKYNEECSVCRWNVKHPVTGRVPLEIDHINGNAEDNSEENLRLICPNCHSLTANFRNLNKGKGRSWRMNKYVKGNNL